MCHRPSRQTVKNENSFVRRFGKSKKKLWKDVGRGIRTCDLSHWVHMTRPLRQVVPIVPGSDQVIEFRVYMHNAEISCRYYYIEFFI